MKGKPFLVQESTSDKEIESLWSEILRVDDTLTRSDTTKKAIKDKENLQKFLESDCRETHYAFSVKKCGSQSCQVCKPPRLPPSVFATLCHLPDPTPRDGHYKSFGELYGTPTTETHRLSLQKAATKGHGMPFNPTSQTAKNTKLVVECEECGKWRVLHSKRVLRKQQLQKIEQELERLDYSCGSVFSNIDADNDALAQVFVRKNLTCQEPIEVPYYGVGHDPICFHCGTVDRLSKVLPDFYPICCECLNQKQSKVPTRGKRMFKPK